MMTKGIRYTEEFKKMLFLWSQTGKFHFKDNGGAGI